MNRAEAERKLQAWKRASAQRDDLIRAALEAGLSINRIHVVSGIGRSTVYRVLEKLTAP